MLVWCCLHHRIALAHTCLLIAIHVPLWLDAVSTCTLHRPVMTRHLPHACARWPLCFSRSTCVHILSIATLCTAAAFVLPAFLSAACCSQCPALVQQHVAASAMSDTSYHPLVQVYLLPTDKPSAGLTLVQPRIAGLQYFAAHHQGSLILLTNDGKDEDYQVMSAPVATPGMANWQTAVPQRPGIAITDMGVFAAHAVLYERHQGRPAVSLLRLPLKDYSQDHSQATANMPLGVVSSTGQNASHSRTEGHLDSGSLQVSGSPRYCRQQRPRRSHTTACASQGLSQAVGSCKAATEPDQLDHIHSQVAAKQDLGVKQTGRSQPGSYHLHVSAAFTTATHLHQSLSQHLLPQPDKHPTERSPAHPRNVQNPPGCAPLNHQVAQQKCFGQHPLFHTPSCMPPSCTQKASALPQPAAPILTSSGQLQQTFHMMQHQQSYASDTHAQQSSRGLTTLMLPDWAMSIVPGGNIDHHSGTVRLHLSSPTHPQHVYDCHLDTGKLELLEVQQVAGHSPEDYVCEMRQALSQDGTQVCIPIACKFVLSLLPASTSDCIGHFVCSMRR